MAKAGDASASTIESSQYAPIRAPTPAMTQPGLPVATGSGGGATQPGDLGEDEPHPVAGLASGAQLGDGLGIGPVIVLRPDETFEIHTPTLARQSLDRLAIR